MENTIGVFGEKGHNQLGTVCASMDLVTLSKFVQTNSKVRDACRSYIDNHPVTNLLLCIDNISIQTTTDGDIRSLQESPSIFNTPASHPVIPKLPDYPRRRLISGEMFSHTFKEIDGMTKGSLDKEVIYNSVIHASVIRQTVHESKKIYIGDRYIRKRFSVCKFIDGYVVNSFADPMSMSGKYTSVVQYIEQVYLSEVGVIPEETFGLHVDGYLLSRLQFVKLIEEAMIDSRYFVVEVEIDPDELFGERVGYTQYEFGVSLPYNDFSLSVDMDVMKNKVKKSKWRRFMTEEGFDVSIIDKAVVPEKLEIFVETTIERGLIKQVNFYVGDVPLESKDIARFYTAYILIDFIEYIAGGENEPPMTLEDVGIVLMANGSISFNNVNWVGYFHLLEKSMRYINTIHRGKKELVVAYSGYAGEI